MDNMVLGESGTFAIDKDDKIMTYSPKGTECKSPCPKSAEMYSQMYA